jgi:hypothetical protein
MDIIVSFIGGGPLDGGMMASDAADPIERHKARLIAQIIGGCLHDAEKREVIFKPGLTYTVPSESMMDKAKRENWNNVKMAALVTKHEYKYSHHRGANGIAEVFMQFVRSYR